MCATSGGEHQHQHPPTFSGHREYAGRSVVQYPRSIRRERRSTTAQFAPPAPPRRDSRLAPLQQSSASATMKPRSDLAVVLWMLMGAVVVVNPAANGAGHPIPPGKDNPSSRAGGQSCCLLEFFFSTIKCFLPA